jgi:WD40 repeat protein
MNADGSNQHLLLAEPDFIDMRPSFTTDGTSILFSAAIYLNPREPTQLQLTPAPVSAFQPDWSPDGSKIVFSTHCCNPQNQEIWVTNTEGNGLRRLTNNGDDYSAGPHNFHPSWSPQGDAIVFERDAPAFSSSGIFIIRADGSGCRKLMNLPTAPRANIPHGREVRGASRRVGTRHVEQIEEGGALPQWGVAPN